MIFQTINAARSNNLSLNYQSCKSSEYKDKGIRKFVFLTKTQIPSEKPILFKLTIKKSLFIINMAFYSFCNDFSWGPTDDGRTVDGPRNATMRAIVR